MKKWVVVSLYQLLPLPTSPLLRSGSCLWTAVFRVNPLQHGFIYKLKCLLLCDVCTTCRGSWSGILPFCNYDFPGASQSCLGSSALSCSRSIGAVCLQQGGQLLVPSYVFYMLWMNCIKSCCLPYVQSINDLPVKILNFLRECCFINLHKSVLNLLWIIIDSDAVSYPGLRDWGMGFERRGVKNSLSKKLNQKELEVWVKRSWSQSWSIEAVYFFQFSFIYFCSSKHLQL